MVINDDRADPAGRLSKGKLRDRNADSESDLEDEFDDLRIRQGRHGAAKSTKLAATTVGRQTAARTRADSRGRGSSVGAAKRKASEAASVHSGAR